MFLERIFSQKTISKGFKRWAKKQEIIKKNVWFISAFVDHIHWVLYVVVLSAQIIVLFDSLHSNPSEKCLNAIFTVINSEIKNTSVDDWQIFAPKNIPKQKKSNCGVHVCIWALSLSTCTYKSIIDEDMDKARVGIANILYYASNDGKSKENKLIENQKACAIKDFGKKYSIKDETPLYDSIEDFCRLFYLLQPEKISLRSKRKT